MTKAAAWMDRVSDRLGSLIPGGDRLPPRHPVKVSLVLAMLGVMSGWVIGGTSFITHWNDPSTNVPIFIASGLSFGLLIFTPILLWADRGYRNVMIAIVYVFIVSVSETYVSNTVLTVLKRLVTTLPAMIAVKGAVFAVLWGTGAILLMRRPAFFWLTFFVALMFITGWTLGFALPNGFSGSQFWILYQSTMYFSSWFMVEHVLSAVCLGMLLWDRTPRLKFFQTSV